MSLKKCLSASVAAVPLFFPIHAHAAIDADASVVNLRVSCSEAGSVLNNCFTTMASLQDWINNTRNPDVSAPLQVDIGPGRFPGFICGNGSSYISFSGAGREQTILGNRTSGIGVMVPGGSHCTHLSFQDMTLEGNLWAVLWTGEGLSTWTNVKLDGVGYGWFDYQCSPGTRGVHYWFSSQIISHNPSAVAKGYGSMCGESWFFGSEIRAQGSQGVKGLYLNNSEAHVYGGVIRAIANPGATFVEPGLTGNGQEEGKGIFAVLSAVDSSIHIHGTGIDVIGNEVDNDVAALIAGSEGEIHANQASYNISTAGDGVKHRIINGGGHVHAPYLWESHATPPNIASVSGADLAVQTNCAASGCQNPGNETHLLLFNSDCTGAGGPWFDVVTGSCR